MTVQECCQTFKLRASLLRPTLLMANHTEGSPDNTFAPILGGAEELAQATVALNRAYDRLHDLRNSLAAFTARRDRLMASTSSQEGGEMNSENQTNVATDTNPSSEMQPGHSAILLSEEDPRVARLPMRLRELSARLSEEVRQLNSRQTSTSIPSPSEPTTSNATSGATEEPLTPPTRTTSALFEYLRRPTPSARDDPNTMMATSLHTLLRRARPASDPNDSSTSLGRRVMHRAAAAAANNNTGSTSNTAGTIVQSNLPLGVDVRSPVVTRPVEPRAATHLRHSLLPNPPVPVRAVARPSTTSRYGEYRPRMTRTAINPPPANPATTSTQIPPGRAPSTDVATGSYRVRRRVNAQGEEQVTNISWSDMDNGGTIFDDFISSLPEVEQWSNERTNDVGRENPRNAERSVVGPASHASPRTNERVRRRGWGKKFPPLLRQNLHSLII